MAKATTTKTTTKRSATPAAKSASKAAVGKRQSRTAAGKVRVSKASSGRHLVIVESPAKAVTVGRFLGADYTVKASKGHVRDLSKRGRGGLGVDIENDFAPQYIVSKGQTDLMDDLTKAGQRAEDIYLATDPDREGEAIAWHVLEAAGWKDKPISRVVFHAITAEAVHEAFQNEREIDMRLVNAQQARRILDRIVGFPLSGLLRKKVNGGVSAGRVQSVALRLVVERDLEIEAFEAVEYWSIKADLATDSNETFSAGLQSRAGEKKITLPNEETAQAVLRDLEGATYAVGSVTKRQVKRRPSAPFITSTLQQEASRKLGFSATRTMSAAQQLYEGINLGAQGTVGLITYMRTDSPVVTPSAIEETRRYIEGRWGKEYLPASARRYTSRSKVAQEAHEAIRPTSIARDPNAVRAALKPDQARLYELIWNRMVASQMADTVLDSTQVDIPAGAPDRPAYVFHTSGSVVRFPGFGVLYMESRDESANDSDDDRSSILPELRNGQPLTCRGLTPDQHFTQPLPRFNDASLIKALEERGIGRPSTYAPTINTIVTREYVERTGRVLTSTKLGRAVCQQLIDHFPDIMNPGFTAQFEEQLDEVANGKQEWVPLLRDFYGPFTEALTKARDEMPYVSTEDPTNEVCELCGRAMVIKYGRFGKFLSCSGFPECRNGKPIPKETKPTGAHCPRCGGDLVQRRSKRGPFYGCSNYPTCNFLVNKQPLPQPCPECGGLMVISGRDQSACTNCAWKGAIPEEEPVGVA